jgi:hypothetical protein
VKKKMSEKKVRVEDSREYGKRERAFEPDPFSSKED